MSRAVSGFTCPSSLDTPPTRAHHAVSEGYARIIPPDSGGRLWGRGGGDLLVGRSRRWRGRRVRSGIKFIVRLRSSEGRCDDGCWDRSRYGGVLVLGRLSPPQPALAIAPLSLSGGVRLKPDPRNVEREGSAYTWVDGRGASKDP